MKESKNKTILIMGLALFATFFGAGNLIFPPFLGNEVGSAWFVGFIGFFIVDVGLSVLAIWASVLNKRGEPQGVVSKIGETPGKVFLSVCILCIGPGLAIPRTGAVTYEMSIQTLMPSVNSWIFSAIFFGVALALTIRPTKVVDIVGNYLTPILVATMAILIIMGIVSPLGPASATPDVVPLREGLMQGYQTMDALGALLMAGIVISAAHSKGYTEKGEVSAMIVKAGAIAGILLGLVYGGLTYLGATTSTLADYAGMGQAQLLLAIVNGLMGKAGVILLAIVVLLACMTTAIGLTSVAGHYFADLSGGKLPYKYLVIAIHAFSFVVSNIGLSNIISISAPILTVLFPPLMVLVIMTFVDNALKKETYAAAVGTVFAFIVSACEVLTGFGLPLGFVGSIPLAQFGLAWLIPAIIGAIIGFFIKRNVPEQA